MKNIRGIRISWACVLAGTGVLAICCFTPGQIDSLLTAIVATVLATLILKG